MTIYNINITTPNNTNTYFVKSDTQPTYDYIQCLISEAEGIAVLRYSPNEAEVVAGEVYANHSTLTKYIPFPITYESTAVNFIDIFVKKHADTEWLKYGSKIPVTGLTEIGLLPSDFQVGDDIDVKLKNNVSDAFDTLESQHIYATLTIDTYPSETRLATNFTVSGKANLPDGSELTLRFTSAGGFQEYTVIVNDGAWSETVAQVDSEHGFITSESVDILIYWEDTPLSSAEVVNGITTTATIVMDPIGEQTEGVAFDVTGTAHCSVVKVLVDGASQGTANVSGGNFALEITIASTGSKVIRVEDNANSDAYDSETITVVSGKLIIDNFESYATGSNPFGQGWYKEPSTPNTSIIELDGSDKVWKIRWDAAYDHVIYKNFSAVNLKDKTLKIKLKGTQVNKGALRVYMCLDGDVKESFSTAYVVPTSWTTKTYSLTYDGNVNRLMIYLYAENNVYFNDIIVE